MPLRLLRLANPVVRALLRSPAHPVLSRSLAVLTYTGRRSGRSFSIPVMVVEREADVVALAARPGTKRWWRTFETPSPATLLVRRTSLAVTGAMLTEDGRRAALRAYLGRYPRARGALGLASEPGDDELDRVDAVLVSFRRRDA